MNSDKVMKSDKRIKSDEVINSDKVIKSDEVMSRTFPSVGSFNTSALNRSAGLTVDHC
jgi:hypothetical protein